MIDRRDRGKLLFLGSIAVSAVLVLSYLAAGGASYAPAKTQDPCKPRPWRNPQGLDEIAQQFSLSALDGAACELGVSREELVLSMRSQHDLSVFLRSHHVGVVRLTQALRSGGQRAVDQAERQGWLSGLQALAVRAIVANVPLDALIRAIRDRSLLG